MAGTSSVIVEAERRDLFPFAGTKASLRSSLAHFNARDPAKGDLPVVGGMAFGINDAGEIVGTVRVRQGQARSLSRVAIWDQGSWRDLGYPKGSDGMTARGIIAKGDVIGSATANAAIYWKGSDSFEVLPNLKDGWICSGLAINNQGQAVGVCNDPNSANDVAAAMWQEHKAVKLANPCGTGDGLTSYARSISDTGVIGGSAGNCAVTWHVSNPDQAVIMADYGVINSINAGGEMVGVIGNPDTPGVFGSQPARWGDENAPAIDLSPDAATHGYARWINDQGRYVGHITKHPGESFGFVSQ
jgi:uncharacterized membrane protein